MSAAHIVESGLGSSVASRLSASPRPSAEPRPSASPRPSAVSRPSSSPRPSVVSRPSVPARLAASGASVSLLQEDTSSRFFPFDVLSCCPSGATACFRPTWRIIQDGTHAVLILGVFSSIVLVLMEISTIVFEHSCFVEEALFCSKEILGILFILPVAFYFIRTIEQYDDRLSKKMQECEVKKENLNNTYNLLLVEMNGFLDQATKSNSKLAEISFESKRRDFDRYIKNTKRKYSTMVRKTRTPAEARHFEIELAELLVQFRLFCMHWLSIFEECSVNPIRHPHRPISESDMNGCKSIVEVCDLLLSKISGAEIRFIDDGIEEGRTTVNSFCPPDLTQSVTRKGWLQCCSCVGVGAGTPPGQHSEDGFPKQLRLICMRVVFLSSSHRALILCFVAGWMIFAFDLLSVHFLEKPKYLSVLSDLLLITGLELCVVMVLARFDEIDLVQKLEREVRNLELENTRVVKQRDDMNIYFKEVQQLTDIWLYRTVPRLSLMKELHSNLEQIDASALIPSMSEANNQLQDLARCLGPITDWRNDGAMNAATKQKFADDLDALCRLGTTEDIILAMQDVTGSRMRALPDQQVVRG